jgi:hypothetical protein
MIFTMVKNILVKTMLNYITWALHYCALLVWNYLYDDYDLCNLKLFYLN